MPVKGKKKKKKKESRVSGEMKTNQDILATLYDAILFSSRKRRQGKMNKFW